MHERYPIIVIGAGAGGLVVAIGAARAGKSVLLIDKGTWGGDCTNFGCIPSKTLIAAAKEGLKDESFDRVQKNVAEIRFHEEPAALEEKGVKTLTGEAKFLDSHRLQVGDQTVYGDKIVIAAGSSPLIPEIPGLNEAPYLTNETIFDLKSVPMNLCVLGGGPIGCELAQAFARLGTKVTLVHTRENLLKKEEKEASDCLIKVFKQEGIDLYLGYQPQNVGENSIVVSKGEKTHTITAKELLVSVGRRPNVAQLQLEKAGVKFSSAGIPTDIYGRTNKKHIFAVGDITGGPAFTHVAENQGRAVLTSLLLPGPFLKKLDKQSIPRVTFTDPEIASFGLSEEGAVRRYGEKKVAVYTVDLTENDRAITAFRTEGYVKVITLRWNSKILGATIVAPRAGEMLLELQLAKWKGIGLRKLASLIHPYPTYSLAIRKAADLWLTQTVLPVFRKGGK